MKIQVIRYSTSTATETDGMFYSPLTKPRALDDFDINIIDLSVSGMWSYSSSNFFGLTDSNADLLTIQEMVQNSKNTTVVYVMPQNTNYYHNAKSSFKTTTAIKNDISAFHCQTISNAIPPRTGMQPMVFENTRTIINGVQYEADFYIPTDHDIVTSSDRSKKSTTVKISSDVYVTTLDITRTTQALKHFIINLFDKQKQEDAPSWINDIIFYDDTSQQEVINQGNADIIAAQERIHAAEKKLQENARYKSILYTNGDELVSVVFDMLEKILNCDLSQFEDIRKQDFLIKTTTCTFIGEIKGVTSNVKSEHISQTDVHYQSYLDMLAENGIAENVKQLLIINPFRTKALDMRARRKILCKRFSTKSRMCPGMGRFRQGSPWRPKTPGSLNRYARPPA